MEVLMKWSGIEVLGEVPCVNFQVIHALMRSSEEIISLLRPIYLHRTLM